MLKLSRSALELFIRCPKCFYLQKKLGLKPLQMVPLTLAVATDALLKNEFDGVRASGTSHPLWQREKLKVRAYKHKDIDIWRSNFKGIRVLHDPTGAEIFGAIDDIWENLKTGELHIVDYKSTSKKEDPTLDGGFGDGYKRQMEIYQWLFRNAGFKVSKIGYFLYVNGMKENNFYENDLDGVMHFDTVLISYTGNDKWVEKTINDAVECLHLSAPPQSANECDPCRYFEERQNLQPRYQ